MNAVARVLLSVALIASGDAAQGASDAATILKAADVRGGLCLVIGARSPALAAALARESTLYVQVLQPDWKTARAWGAQCAGGPHREQIGVRHAAFDAGHYDSSLFNVIVVEDPSALGQAKATDLCRILVPRGVVVFRQAAPGFAEAAATRKMEPVAVSGFAAAFRRPLPPATWKLPLALKWRAGPRSQIASGYAGICAAGGKLFYLERTELDSGDLIRTLPVGGFPAFLGMSAAGGRLYLSTREGKLICFDGESH